MHQVNELVEFDKVGLSCPYSKRVSMIDTFGDALDNSALVAQASSLNGLLPASRDEEDAIDGTATAELTALAALYLSQVPTPTSRIRKVVSCRQWVAGYFGGIAGSFANVDGRQQHLLIILSGDAELQVPNPTGTSSGLVTGLNTSGTRPSVHE